MKRYVYTIGYFDGIDEDNWYLVSDKLYTSQEFEDLIIKTAEKPLREAVEKFIDYFPTFEDIYLGIIEILCKEYGFEELEITEGILLSNFSLFDSDEQIPLFVDNHTHNRLSKRAIEIKNEILGEKQ